MSSDDSIKKITVLIAMFLIMLLSYGPLSIEIHTQAIGEASNSIWLFLDSTFQLWWSFMIIAFVGLALWSLAKEF